MSRPDAESGSSEVVAKNMPTVETLGDGRFEYLVAKKFTITGLDVDDPGVVLDPQPRPSFVMHGIETQTLERLGL